MIALPMNGWQERENPLEREPGERESLAIMRGGGGRGSGGLDGKREEKEEVIGGAGECNVSGEDQEAREGETDLNFFPREMTNVSHFHSIGREGPGQAPGPCPGSEGGAEEEQEGLEEQPQRPEIGSDFVKHLKTLWSATHLYHDTHGYSPSSPLLPLGGAARIDSSKLGGKHRR